MMNISKVVDSLEVKIKKLIQKHEKCTSEKLILEEKIKEMKQQNNQSKNDLEVLQSEFNALKTASSILGSDRYKRETKLKINTLIREIDTCIAQLSD